MNQKKQNINTHTSAPAIIGLLVIVLIIGGYFIDQRKTQRKLDKAQAALKQNESKRKSFVTNASKFQQNAQILHIIDSINERNDYLIGGAFDNYFEKLDKKYTLGRFLDAGQIAKINGVISSHLHKVSKQNDLVYKYAKSYMPISASTPLRAFEDIVDYLQITPVDLMPYGVEFDNGAIFQFYKPAAQDLFYKYLDEYEAAYATDTEPNFEIKDIAPTHDEYVANCNKISELKNQITYNDSIFNQNLARFDATRDSLNRVISDLKSKFK